MDIKNIVEFAKQKRRKPKNIVARGLIINFLLYNNYKRYLPDEIQEFLEIPQSTFYDNKNKQARFEDHYCCEYFNQIINDNHSQLFELINKTI